MQLLPILVLFGLFYFVILRPQQAKTRRLRELASVLGVGDEVVAASGIIGVIESIDGDRAELTVAPGVTLTMLRAALTRKASEDPLPPRARRRGRLPAFTPPGSDPVRDEDLSIHDDDISVDEDANPSTRGSHKSDPTEAP